MTCDVLVVGAGAAGTVAAVTAARGGARVILASKEPVGTGDTRISGGIISSAGVLPDDSPEQFTDDILRCGGQINNIDLVKVVAEGSRLCSQEFEHWGHIFHRDAQGKISPHSVIRAGGHSRARTLMCVHRGLSISTVLRQALCAQWKGSLELVEEVGLVGLILRHGAAVGARFLHLPSGIMLEARARKVVLATGGAGMLWYPHSDNMRGVTGEGYALAYLAGCRLVDMELAQWIPFSVLAPASLVGIVSGEPSIAGPEGVLRNRSGQIVVDRGLNTMTRAQVSRAIVQEVHAGRGSPRGGLWLDPRANLQTEEGRKVYANWKKIGSLDPLLRAYGAGAYRWEEPYEVAPTQHFFLGGVVIDQWGRTDVPNLFAIGEVAGGVHGADRLGSTALTECLVFGTRAGWCAVQTLAGGGVDAGPEDGADEWARLDGLFGQEGVFTPAQLKLQLGSVMWEKVGTIRTAESLHAALSQLQGLRERLHRLRTPAGKTYNRAVLEAMELRLMLVTAEMVTRSALAREESRGGHFRLDYPEESGYWQQRNVLVSRGREGMQVAVGAKERAM